VKIAASALFVSTLAITLCTPAHAQQQATVTACKPGTGVRLWKHFMSLRAYARIDCGSTVEVLSYSQTGQWARVRQGKLEGYIEPWHIYLGGSQANTAPHSALGTFLSAIAQGLQAYGNAAMAPSERLARTCLATPGCTLEAQQDQQWTPVTQPQQAEQYPQTSNFRLVNGGTSYTATVIQPSGTFKGHPLPTQSSPALVLEGGGLSLAIVNGYAYTLGTDGQWHPTGLGPGNQQGVEGQNP
jgi:hypothetical protein